MCRNLEQFLCSQVLLSGKEDEDEEEEEIFVYFDNEHNKYSCE